MPTTAAANGPVHARRRRLGVVGAAFVGSTLIAMMAPAHAEPTDPPEVSLSTYEAKAKPGEELTPNKVSVSNNGDATLCLLGLSVDPGGLDTNGFDQAEVEPGDTAANVANISGSLGEPGTHTIRAVLTYAYADPEEGCPGPGADGESAYSGEWTITVAEEEEPSPTPTPTETPTETPTAGPTETPPHVPSAPPDPTESETDERTPPPEEPPPASDPTEETGGGSDGGSSDSGGNTSSPRNSNPQSNDPGPNADDPPTSDATVPELPRDEADLPDVSPGAEDLAELPTVTPESEDDELDQSEAAADHGGAASMAPAVLLAAFLLALLLATPLAPTRRVRLGILGYQGKRRKGRF